LFIIRKNEREKISKTIKTKEDKKIVNLFETCNSLFNDDISIEDKDKDKEKKILKPKTKTKKITDVFACSSELFD